MRRNPRPELHPVFFEPAAPIIHSLIEAMAEGPINRRPNQLKQLSQALSSVALMAKLEARLGPLTRPVRKRRNA